MIESPTKELRDAAFARLADPISGFNWYVAEASAAYLTNPFEIGFDGASGNFFQAAISPELLPQVDDFNYPFLCLYGMKGENAGNHAISAAFDGDILIGIDVFLSWNGLESLVNYEAKVDAVEAALISTFDINRHPGVTYSSYAFSRTPLTNPGNVWTSSVSLRLVSQVTER